MNVDMAEQFAHVVGRRLTKAEPTKTDYYECGFALTFDDGARIRVEFVAGGALSDVTIESGSFDVYYEAPPEAP